MARIRSLCLVLAAFFSISASAESGSQVKSNGAEYDAGIKVADQFASNATAKARSTGWYPTEICYDGYCVWSNQGFGNGRGLVMITMSEYTTKIKSIQKPGSVAHGSKESGQKIYDITEVEANRVGIVANQPLKRGTRLLTAVPVLVVSKRFIFDVPEDEQNRLFQAALSNLPDKTREAFLKQGEGGAKIKDIILATPFEADLSLGRDEESGGHFFNYPEAAAFGQDCRPNVVFHIDGNTATLGTTVVRKVEPGERLTISFIDPLQPRDKRQKMHQSWKKSACTCSQCHRDLGFLAQSDANLKEIGEIEKELKAERPKPTTAMIARLIELYKKERLEARLAAAYEHAALNYNYLGYDKKAKKYAVLAQQAWLLEEGQDSNSAVAMRILAENTKTHYSYKYAVQE